MRRAKGFTLVELLVVIAIIALLMGILMPALARVRSIAFRMTCGTNLAGIGKAMMIYANDYEEEFPRSGWPKSALRYELAGTWYEDTRALAFGNMPSTITSQATVTSSLYTLIKFADVTPKSFVCKGDTGVAEFELADDPDHDSLPDGLELADAWDFGAGTNAAGGDYGADEHCSYAYHHPFCQNPLSSASEPAMPVAADPNPWFTHAGMKAKAFPGEGQEGTYGSEGPFVPDEYPDTAHIKYGNANTHQEEGQNVLFVDGSVAFEKNSFCGIEEDNIYTVYDGVYIKQGHPTTGAAPSPMEPWGRKDAYLISNHADSKSPWYMK